MPPKPKRGRGRPPKSESKKALEAKSAPFGTKNAARTLRKNARSMVKLAQLLELKTAAKSSETLEKHPLIGMVQARVDKLKDRINRRLIKLSRWADHLPREKEKFVFKSGFLLALPLLQYSPEKKSVREGANDDNDSASDDSDIE